MVSRLHSLSCASERPLLDHRSGFRVNCKWSCAWPWRSGSPPLFGSLSPWLGLWDYGCCCCHSHLWAPLLWTTTSTSRTPITGQTHTACLSLCLFLSCECCVKILPTESSNAEPHTCLLADGTTPGGDCAVGLSRARGRAWCSTWRARRGSPRRMSTTTSGRIRLSLWWASLPLTLTRFSCPLCEISLNLIPEPSMDWQSTEEDIAIFERSYHYLNVVVMCNWMHIEP